MATDENDARPEAAEKSPPAPESENEQGKAVSTSDPRAVDDEGWPRSWIVVASVLGIVAIIIIARLAGRDWHKESEGLEPAPPAAPGPTSAPTRLELAGVDVPPGGSCLGRDGKMHTHATDLEAAAKAPEHCRLGLGGTKLRVEIHREHPNKELMLWVYGAGTDPVLLLHAHLLPRPEEPVWIATNQGGGHQVLLMLHNPHKAPTRLRRMRLLLVK